MAESGEAYALILLDAMMPIMDGFMVAQAIREDQRFEPVTIMMLSSADRPDDCERCHDLGINLYVRKPVKHSELWNAIQSALGKSAKASEASPAVLVEPPRKLRILLAEDNPVNQYMAVVLLEERGHTVKVANNGQEVLDILATDTLFDLILMDVQMPVMDGFQATEAIRATERETGKHMRIIAMTAHALKGDKERCLAVGMDDYIAKPVQEQDLLAMVECWNMVGTEQADSNSVASALLAEPALDWQQALNRVRGRQHMLCKMMTLFQEQSTPLLNDMADAIQRQDADLLRLSAHTLKSSANSIGAFPFGKIAQQLETMGHEAAFVDAAASYELLQQANIMLEPAIQDYLHEFQE
jgi:CheY-like chemotaxis protein